MLDADMLPVVPRVPDKARVSYKNSGPAWTRRLWRPVLCRLTTDLEFVAEMTLSAIGQALTTRRGS